MAAHIVVPCSIDKGNLSGTPTSQAGARPLAAIPATGNVGGMTFAPGGTPTAVINERVEIVDEGDLKTATFKTSADGGTNFKGRCVDTTWDGNGATERTVLADTGQIYPSKPCIIDSNGDGIDDRVLVAVSRASTTPDQIDILYTDDLTGAGSWSTLKSDATGSDIPAEAAPVLVRSGANLFLFAVLATSNDLVVYKSTDNGANWSAKTTVTAATAATDAPDAILLASGKLLVVYTISDGGYTHIYCKSSADGTTWGSARKITAAGSVNYILPCVVQEADGKTVCFMYRTTATAALKARQTTAADPGAAAWSADYSETLAAAVGTQHTACIAPDGTIYLVTIDSPSAFAAFSKFKDGDANYSAFASAYDPTGDLATVRVACIGGALWLTARDGDNTDALLVATRYWTTYNGTNAPASWTGTAAQFLHDGLWLTPGGAEAAVGDIYDIDSTYDYGAERAFAGQPRRPLRSTADEAEWNAVFDAGANGLWVVDTICGMGNIEHCHIQMNASDSWGSPSVNTSLSFVKQTIGSASLTLAAGQITINAGALTPHSLKGHRARFATSGGVYLIDDNTADKIWCHGDDVDAETGDLQILSPRAWATQTLSGYRYLRILIDSQKTAENYYSLLLAVGIRTALAATRTLKTTRMLIATDDETVDGILVRRTRGPARRSWQMTIVKPTVAEVDEISAILANQDSAPLALVPDTSKATDWALVHAGQEYTLDAIRTMLNFSEVV